MWSRVRILRRHAHTQQPGGAGVDDAVLGGLEDGVWQGDGVAHHGAVEPVLRHDGAATPTLLPLPPLGPPVLEPNLWTQRQVLTGRPTHGY